MLGDKVIVGDGYHWKESDGQRVMAYMPKLDSEGQWIVVDGKTVMVEPVGGVICGSKGIVDGNIIRVNRSNIHSSTKGYGGNDFVELIPVNLERYQRVGYFLIEHIRISDS